MYDLLYSRYKKLENAIKVLRPLQIDFLFPVHCSHGLFVKPENSIINVFQVPRDRLYGFLLKCMSLRALVNVTIYDRCCKKTVLSWTICAIDEDENTVKDFLRAF